MSFREIITARRIGRLLLFAALHFWGPLFLLVTNYKPTVVLITASLIFSVLLTGSVTLPYMLSRRHGWLRALLVSSLVFATLFLPLGLLSANFSVSAAADRSEIASWVFVGLVLPPVLSFVVFVPLSFWRWFPAALRSLRGRRRTASPNRPAKDGASPKRPSSGPGSPASATSRTKARPTGRGRRR